MSSVNTLVAVATVSTWGIIRWEGALREKTRTRRGGLCELDAKTQNSFLKHDRMVGTSWASCWYDCFSSSGSAYHISPSLRDISRLSRPLFSSWTLCLCRLLKTMNAFIGRGIFSSVCCCGVDFPEFSSSVPFTVYNKMSKLSFKLLDSTLCSQQQVFFVFLSLPLFVILCFSPTTFN